MVTLADVKAGLNITGSFLDTTLTVYMNEVTAFLRDAGVPDALQTAGLVTRGVADLWNYGGADGRLSEYFMQRATQLALR